MDGATREPELAAEGRSKQRRTVRLRPSLAGANMFEARAPESEEASPAGAGPADTQSEVPAAGEGAQIRVLERQRGELLSIIESWAKEYRAMVEYYREKVQDLQTLKKEEEEKHLTCRTTVKSFKERESTWPGNRDVISELLKATEEAEELRAQNRTLTRRGQHQHKEILRLNKALEENLQPGQPQGVSGETVLDVWQHQAEVYKEDFLKERRDLKKLKEKYVELERRFRKTHSELQLLKSQATWSQPLLNCTCKRAKRDQGNMRGQREQGP
ncbi:TNFAIP3-interacting protein 1-like [Aulostomus maculatus]